MVSTRLMSSGAVNVASQPEETHSEPSTSRQSNRIHPISEIHGPHEEMVRTVPSQTVFFLDMPQEIFEKILSNLTFKNIGNLRLVSRRMDQVCGNILNSTFQKLQKQMLSRYQNIKAKMPRRESARRTHPLACESDIIETLHMRLTLLQMSFGKHIERRYICFFAGEVLDEVYRILHYVKKTTKLQRPYKVTDELFDLSSMAMEYFKEHLEPRLPEIAYFTSDFLEFTGGTFEPNKQNKSYLCLDSSPLGAGSSGEQKDDEVPILSDPCGSSCMQLQSLPQTVMALRRQIRTIKIGMRRFGSTLSLTRRDVRLSKRKYIEQQKQMIQYRKQVAEQQKGFAEQLRQLAEQQKQTLEYATRLDENEKKNEETSRKFSTLLQELNKCKNEYQYWRSKSPAIPPVCQGCGSMVTPVPQEEFNALINQSSEENLEDTSTEEIQIPLLPIEAPVQSPAVVEPPVPVNPTEAPVDISPPQSPSQHTRQQGSKRKHSSIQPVKDVNTSTFKRAVKRKK